MQMAPDGGAEIAKRSRGTPRVANRLLRRVRDFADVGGARDRRCQGRRLCLDATRGRRPRARRDGPPLPRLHRRELRRRPGRRRDAGGGAVRAARRDRGRDRAVSDAARPADAHAARAALVGGRLPPSRQGRAEGAKQQLDLLTGAQRQTAGRTTGRDAASEAPTSGRIEGGRHILPLRVYYEDTDAQGIVYYANWLRFLERGRTELLRLLGLEHAALRAERGVCWVVRRCTVDYLKPARLDETIDVVTGCGEMRGASLEMLQEARRDDELLVRAELLIACMSDAVVQCEYQPMLGRRWTRLQCPWSRPAHAIFGYEALERRSTK